MYYLIIQRYISETLELSDVYMLCMSQSNAMRIAREQAVLQPAYAYDVYRIETGTVLTDAKPIYTTEGDELPW